MSYNISFIDVIHMVDMADKLFKNQIALSDGEMIALRNLYRQLDKGEQEFITNKYGESMDFLENYSGVRKRKDL